MALLTCAASVASMLVVRPPAVARPLRRPAAAAAAARLNAPRLLIAKTDSRVVALADVHGDYRALCAALIAAGLLDVKTGGWCGCDATRRAPRAQPSRLLILILSLRRCGGDTMLVQLGDILDRGDSEAECWELLQRLKEEAPACGGGVVCLVGIHLCSYGDATPRPCRTVARVSAFRAGQLSQAQGSSLRRATSRQLRRVGLGLASRNVPRPLACVPRTLALQATTSS